MRAHWMMVAMLPLALAGCDSDVDGLSNSEEAELGTDPDKVDTDDDGLSDFTEVEQGLDPLAADTDQDGFTDGEEFTKGTDGTDPMSYERTTEGEWPDLSGWADTEGSTGFAIGDQLQNMKGEDQFGNDVELYQFWGNVILIDFSAGWCPPCRAVAANAEEEYRNHADKGFLIVHMMTDDNSRDGTIQDPEFLAEWTNDFNLTFPVVDSPDARTVLTGLGQQGLYTGGIPFMILVDQDMKIVQAETGSGSETRLITKAEELLGN